MSTSYLSVSIGQELGSGLAVCFWIRVSWCCSQHVSRGDMLEGAVGSNSKMSHLPDDWQVGAGCFSLYGSLHKAPWVSLGHDIRLGQEQVVWKSQDSLWLHRRIHTLIFSISYWLHSSALSSAGGNYTKVWVLWGKDHCGPSFRLTTTTRNP